MTSATPTAEADPPGSGRAALRHRDFRLYLGASFLSTVAIQMQSVAIGWQVYDLTRDPLDLGLVGLAEFLPAIGLALLTGHVADRFDRRSIIRLGFGLELTCAALLLLISQTGVTQVWPFFAVAVLFGVARAFVAPAARALMPNLVPTADFANAVAWHSSAWQIATIGGPALGGFAYALGPSAAYGGAATLLAGAILMVVAMGGRAVRGQPEAADWTSLLAGIALIRRRPILLGAISLDLFAVLFSGAVALLPVFARDILFVGPVGLGLLRSAPGIGAVVTALVLARWPLTRHVGRTLFACIGVFGVATIVFGLSTEFWLSMAALTVLGAADMVSIFIRGTLVPLFTPDHMRGRVMAVEQAFIGASNELGAFEAGVAATLLGAVPAVLFGGLATLTVALLWMWWFPALRRVDRLEAPH